MAYLVLLRLVVTEEQARRCKLQDVVGRWGTKRNERPRGLIAEHEDPMKLVMNRADRFYVQCGVGCR
jgi:hypothetical protein